MTDRFPNPFEIAAPPGAEGWERLYPYHLLFSQDRREYEESRFWLQDGIHWPEPLPPWDASFVEYGLAALSQYNTRHYLVPPVLGVDARILNGYTYVSPVSITDGAEIESRIPHFVERAGYYYTHWDELYRAWIDKILAVIAELEDLRFEALPDREPMDVVTTGRGAGSGFDLVVSYRGLLDLSLRVWQHHFEFLNLGYAAYLDFFSFCKGLFPGMPEVAIAKMVAGVDIELFRPDDELKCLARTAVDLGIGDVFEASEDGETILAKMRRTAPGRQWLECFEAARQPWFNFSTGSGMYHTDRVWNEHLSVPLGFIADYVGRLTAGERIDRPLAELRAERDRIASEYAALIDGEDRRAFEDKLELARTVFPFVENHNFYVEHWGHSVIWRKMRDVGRLLEQQEFLGDADDVFYLTRNEVGDALSDYYAGWATGVPPRGPGVWPRETQRRRAILAALRDWSPPKALGVPPDVVTEPFTVMLWGVTSESIRQWLGQEAGGDLAGFAASPGVAEGPARVVFCAAEVGEVQAGEILVAPLTAPAWAPVFSKIAATVTDVGGIMSHAAIVCREYGLPAVTGTGFGTRRIVTGQRIRVDGTAGTVTFLD